MQILENNANINLVIQKIKQEDLSVQFDKEDKFLYFNSPKNSQTSIRSVLLKEKRVLSKKNNYEEWLSKKNDLNLEKFQKMIKFSVLRHPKERIMSTYRYFLKNNIINENFNDFILKRIDTSERRLNKERFKNYNVWDHHLNPQFTSTLIEDKIFVNHIFIMEKNYEEEINLFFSNNLDIKSKIPHLNKTKFSEDLFDYVNKESLEKFLLFYEKDNKLYKRLTESIHG